MFFRILLGSFCLHLVTSTPTDVQVTNSTEDVDEFITFLATPVKDEFDWKLLQKYTSGYKNVILSPISLKLVLALLYEGASGTTEKEFQNVLKFPADKVQLRRNFSDLLTTLSVNTPNYVINIGTQLFLDSHLHVEPTFKIKAYAYYRSQIASTNFSHPHDASTMINNWVANLTLDRIKSIVTPDDVENAVLLVANAMYFKGVWLNPFMKNETFTGGFHTSITKSVPVSYMTLTEKFFYYNSKSLDAEILRLPYKGRKFALYIVLPHSKDGLSHLIQHLNFDDLTLSVRFMEQHPIKVILPKLRFDFQTKYSQVLREFGFDELFRGVASFPCIVRDQEAQLIVTDILQKSGIEVNEEGSVVHTSTQVIIGNKFGDENIITFNASRPFLFYIQEEVTQNILFIGKIENPLEQDSNSDASNVHVDYKGESISTVPQSDQTTIYQPTVPARKSFFDLELLKKAASTSKNVFLSPSSIKVTLAMLAQAGSGATSDEIYYALQIPLHMRNKIILQNLVGELNASYPHSTLKFQNSLFVSDKESVKTQYQTIVEQYYGALLRKINYNNAEYAASEINSFINKATDGFIPAVISPGDIDPYTKIILANALYFKATWLKRFDSKLTKLGCFHAPRDCVTVSLMHIIDIFLYRETDNSYIVQLNYAGNQRAMLLVVPKYMDGLLAALRDIESFRSFSDLIESLNQTEVELIMPKFEINYYTNLVGTLETLGIRTVFGSNSNLNNLFETNSSGLVDSFIHKAKIEVTEDGTEAAAVSLVPVIPLMGTTTPKIIANQPFAFFVYNTETKTVLFEGILNEPEQSALQASKIRSQVFPQFIPPEQLAVLPLQTERQAIDNF